MHVNMVHDVIMKLAKWMSAHEVMDQEIADKIGVDRSYVTKLRNDQVVPSLQVAARIEKLTAGQVTRYDWPVEQNSSPERVA